MKKGIKTIILALTLLSCTNKKMDEVITTASTTTTQSGDSSAPLTYLALGDSYTIGESVAPEVSFPYELSARLHAKYSTGTPTIVARTGWTTADLISAINRITLNKTYGIVTLLIGVNNQYQYQDIALYRTQFAQLLNTAINFAGGNKKHVFVLSIPDWSVTPYAAASGRDIAQIATEIDQYNAINKEQSLQAGVNYTDITPISRMATTDPGLIAADGLHPSPTMYSLWVSKMLDQVLAGVADVK
ncbi:SGNH/GDSL hydrolase family protein [Mucilaginibacter robiniae]|uniref:SGNH/GDSL hydrolase family protein n=1 Tax=Mucilaginibacter robiniae TaxID=2728022 RepID=A0A7L5E193_9SPHI|nr:SGNH/GDSL hydrolase family protein [Mucilaginibacter robiniae]QJD97132.1 SGNH/GDSL hydrolase family protein [Mucilaginibacter robiniae]